MDLSRSVYSRDLKIATMRALDAGTATTREIARGYQLSPKPLESRRGGRRETGGEIARECQRSTKVWEGWRGEGRAKGGLAFPEIGRGGAGLPAVDDSR